MMNDLAVSPKIAESEAVFKTSGVRVRNTAEMEKNEVGVDTHIQRTEDSTFGSRTEKEILADEIEAAGTALLSVFGYLNGFP